MAFSLESRTAQTEQAPRLCGGKKTRLTLISGAGDCVLGHPGKSTKAAIYEKIKLLYHIIWQPILAASDRHQPFEVYVYGMLSTVPVRCDAEIVWGLRRSILLERFCGSVLYDPAGNLVSNPG